MTETVINSAGALSQFIGELREIWGQKKWLKVTVKDGKPRSIDQNSISHAWYKQIADELREDTALQVKCYCKLTLGVPILRAEDEQFRAFYDRAIKRTLSYEQKLEAMAFVPVTSLMTKAQLSQYLDAMRAHYEGRVALEFPSED